MKIIKFIVLLYLMRVSELLKQIYNPPWVLYIKGNIELLTRETIGCCWCEKTDYIWNEALKRFYHHLVERDLSIISGIAKGIDAACSSN